MTERITRKRMMKQTLHRYYIHKKRKTAKRKKVTARQESAWEHTLSREAKSRSFITPGRRPIPRPPRPHRRMR